MIEKNNSFGQMFGPSVSGVQPGVQREGFSALQNAESSSLPPLSSTMQKELTGTILSAPLFPAQKQWMKY